MDDDDDDDDDDHDDDDDGDDDDDDDDDFRHHDDKRADGDICFYKCTCSFFPSTCEEQELPKEPSRSETSVGGT